MDVRVVVVVAGGVAVPAAESLEADPYPSASPSTAVEVGVDIAAAAVVDLV